jgi:hypothetical protein
MGLGPSDNKQWGAVAMGGHWTDDYRGVPKSDAGTVKKPGDDASIDDWADYFGKVSSVLKGEGSAGTPGVKDSIVMHRSQKNEKMSDKNTAVYGVSFSYVSNGEETPIDVVMYMFSNIEGDAEGNNELTNVSYVLRFANMTSDEHYNEILVQGAGGGQVFLHAGKNYGWFGGCKGLTYMFISTGKNGVKSSLEMSQIASNSVKALYDKYSSKLTGSKFILRPNSNAKPFIRILPLNQWK